MGVYNFLCWTCLSVFKPGPPSWRWNRRIRYRTPQASYRCAETHCLHARGSPGAFWCPTSTHCHKVKGLWYICKHSAAQSNNPNYAKREVVTTAFLCLSLAPVIVMVHEDTGLQSIFGISRKQPFSIQKQAQWLIGVGIKITFCFMMCGLMKVLNYSNDR